MKWFPGEFVVLLRRSNDFLGHVWFCHVNSMISLKLYGVIIDKANSINQTHCELITLWTQLHCCDIVRGLLPINNFSLIYIPYPNHFVKTSWCHVVLTSWFYKKCRAKNIWMLQNLNWFIIIRCDFPYHNDAISTNRKKVWWRRILWTPIDFKYIWLMIVVPLLEWFWI